MRNVLYWVFQVLVVLFVLYASGIVLWIVTTSLEGWLGEGPALFVGWLAWIASWWPLAPLAGWLTDRNRAWRERR